MKLAVAVPDKMVYKKIGIVDPVIDELQCQQMTPKIGQKGYRNEESEAKENIFR